MSWPFDYSAVYSEADEVADGIEVDLSTIRTMDDARRVIRQQIGTPDDVGHQLSDNMAESLFNRAVASRR